MIASHGVGVQADVSHRRLPSDAYPALFAYSLNRKLRYRYYGPYFRYRQESGGEYEYPERIPDLTEKVYLVKIYDQKERFGVPVQNAEQLDNSKQPLIEIRNSGPLEVGSKVRIIRTTHPYYQQTGVVTNLDTVGFAIDYDDDQVREVDGGVNYSAEGTTWVKLEEYVAVFNQKEYLDVQNLAPYIGQNFTITAVGEGAKVPRPMIGIWGQSDRITFEPSELTTRFSFNSNLGSIASAQGTAQCFSGFDKTQNYTNVMSVKSRNIEAHRTRAEINPSFTNISVGREDQRLYKGSFREAVMHLGNLTPLGAEQLYTTTKTYYGY